MAILNAFPPRILLSNRRFRTSINLCHRLIRRALHFSLSISALTVSMSSHVLAQEIASDQISQVSVINALLLGQYQGTMSLEKLLRMGDFGVGTVDQLDGELIVLDGVAYQARSDGSVRRCEPQMTTPFAVVTPFEGEESFTLPVVSSLEQLEFLLESRLPSRDLFAAVRVEATFDSISLRAVPKQEPPYRPLAEVVKNQAQWERKQITGTLIGIRSPAWVTGIGIPGFHWHFLSQDRQSGGHVFNCRFESGHVSFDRCRTWTIELGDSLGTDGKNLNQDLSKELDQVEKQRGTSPPTSPSR